MKTLFALWLGALLGTSAFAAEIPNTGVFAKLLQPYVDSNSLAGIVVLAADKDRILDLEAVGYADVAAKKPMQVDTIFWIASMTKPVTATALMMLVDEGKVNLDDPVQKYIPEFKLQMVVDPKDPTDPPKPASHAITVREILSHTSGLPFHPQAKIAKGDAISLEDEARVFAAEPLTFDPGSSYAYSNEGFIVVGRVIEVASGIPYEKFVQDRILTPLGMTETRFVPTADEVTRLAKTYQANATRTGIEELVDALKSGLTFPLDDPKRLPFPAGGLFSTATDMSKFCEMYLNGGVYQGTRYLSEKALKEMTMRQTPPALKDDYGLGWGLGPRHEFFHAGGYKTYMEIDPETGRLLVYMVQFAGHDWPNNGNTLMRTIRDAAAKLPSPAK
jgi:CubicO group peptidase (beta-lactamase class C family)